MENSRACYAEWSKSERERESVLTHIYGTYKDGTNKSILQGSHGNTDIEERLVDTVGEGEGGMSWKSDIETYTLLYVK